MMTMNPMSMTTMIAADTLLEAAVMVTAEATRTGRKVNVNGFPDLDRSLSYAVVKFLLLKIDINEELRLKNFGTMNKCNVWLGGIGRGMTWDEHMEAVVAELRAKLGAPLFALGGAYWVFLANEAFPHHLYNVMNGRTDGQTDGRMDGRENTLAAHGLEVHMRDVCNNHQFYVIFTVFTLTNVLYFEEFLIHDSRGFMILKNN
jgi:hypothetical protein